jgi:hypothetical protein
MMKKEEGTMKKLGIRRLDATSSHLVKKVGIWLPWNRQRIRFANVGILFCLSRTQTGD